MSTDFWTDACGIVNFMMEGILDGGISQKKTWCPDTESINFGAAKSVVFHEYTHLMPEQFNKKKKRLLKLKKFLTQGGKRNDTRNDKRLYRG